MCEGAQEVFEMMVGVAVESCDADPTLQPGEFTAVIGVAGPINGVFSIRCDDAAACGIASGMLGVEGQEARAEAWDALGEVCNMVIGSFKRKTGKLGASSVLSIPTVIYGHDYKVRPLARGCTLICHMKSPDGRVELRLDYKLSS